MTRIAIAVVALLAAGCGAPQPRPRTVVELTAEPLVLQGLLARCAADRHAAASDPECANARLAMDRLGALHDRERAGGNSAEFDRLRELRRVREEQQRRTAATPGFDPYSSPVVPASPPVVSDQR